MITQNGVLSLYNKYWITMDKSHKAILLKGLMDQGMTPLEGLLLYFLIIEKNPEYVIELGPRFGYSTFCISLAMSALGRPRSFTAFELQDIMRDTWEINLRRIGMYPDYVDIKFGDALETVAPAIQDKKIEFMWIDAAHTAEFAQGYISKIFPLLQPKCIVGAHDMTARGQNENGTFDLSITDPGEPTEESVVRKYLLDSGKDYSYFHAIAGGDHSGGRCLPLNKDFHEKLWAITKTNLMDNNNTPQCACWIM